MLDVCRIGGAWCSGVMEEESVAVPISNEEVEVTVAIGIGEGWIGVCTNISNAEGCLSPFLDVCRSGRFNEAASGPDVVRDSNDQIGIGSKGACGSGFREGEEG